MLNDSCSMCILLDVFCFPGLNCSESFRRDRCVDYAGLTAVIKRNFDKKKQRNNSLKPFVATVRPLSSSRSFK